MRLAAIFQAQLCIRDRLKLAAAEARDNAAKLSPRDAAAALRAKADEARCV